MFEQTLEEMKSWIFIGDQEFQMITASNVGLGDLGFVAGYNSDITYERAIEIIKTIDSRFPQFPKYLHKKLRCFRNGIVFAFGPEMEQKVGVIR